MDLGAHVCRHTCVCVQRSEVSVRCLPQCVPTFVSETGALTETEAHLLAPWPANKPRDPPVFLCSTRFIGFAAMTGYCCGVLMLEWQALGQLNLPSPQHQLFWRQGFTQQPCQAWDSLGRPSRPQVYSGQFASASWDYILRLEMWYVRMCFLLVGAFHKRNHTKQVSHPPASQDPSPSFEICHFLYLSPIKTA